MSWFLSRHSVWNILEFPYCSARPVIPDEHIEYMTQKKRNIESGECEQGNRDDEKVAVLASGGALPAFDQHKVYAQPYNQYGWVDYYLDDILSTPLTVKTHRSTSRYLQHQMNGPFIPRLPCWHEALKPRLPPV